MSEDIIIQVTADTSGANASLKNTQNAVKNIGDEASRSDAKTKSFIGGIDKNIVPVAAGMIALRLAMRGVRMAMNELNDAAGEDSLVGGKLKEAAVVASESVKGLETSFSKFGQTAMSAIAPVIGAMSDDLSSALNDSTKDIEKSTEMVNNFAVAWGSVKTVVVLVGGVLQSVFGALQGILAGLMFAITGVLKAAAFLASMVNKQSGEAARELADVMLASSKELGEKAGKNLADGYEKGVESLTGKVYEKALAGVDKYKNGMSEKFKDIQQQQAEALNAKSDVSGGSKEAIVKVFNPDDVARGQALLTIQAEQVRLAKEHLLAIGDSTVKYAATIEQIKKQNEAVTEYNKNKEKIEADEQKAADERSEKIQSITDAEKASTTEKEEQIKLLEQQQRITQNIYDIEIKKAAAALEGSTGIKTKNPIITTLNSSDLQSKDVNNSGVDPEQEAQKIAKERMDASLKAELESYEQSAQMANEHADRIIEIDKYLNGTIEQQEGKRRTNEIIAEKRNAKLKEVTWQEAANAISGALGNLGTLMQSKNRQLFEIGRAAALAQNVVDTIASAASSFKYGSDLGGPVVGAAFAATAVVAGAVRASALMSAQPGGGSANFGGGYTDTSNTGSPGGTKGAGVGASSQVNVSLYGERFGSDQVRGLIDAINAETKDGKKVTVKV